MSSSLFHHGYSTKLPDDLVTEIIGTLFTVVFIFSVVFNDISPSV